MWKFVALMGLVVGCAPESDEPEVALGDSGVPSPTVEQEDSEAPTGTVVPPVTDCYAEVLVVVDEVPVSTELEVYDHLDRLVYYQVDDDGDDKPDYVEYTTYHEVWGDQESFVVDDSGRGDIAYQHTYTYDSDGNRVELLQEGFAFGWLNRTTEWQYTDGLQTLTRVDDDNDGVIDEERVLIYDDGALLEVEVDSGVDGRLEERHHYSYPTPGERDYRRDVDLSDDGTIEDVIHVDFDELDRVISYDFDYQQGGNTGGGTYAYDAESRLVGFEYEEVLWGETYALSQVWTYDTRLSTFRETIDLGGVRTVTDKSWTWHCD